MYSTFGHHPHPQGYLCAKFCFFRGFHCWASPWRKIAFSINHSPSLFNALGTKAVASELQTSHTFHTASKLHETLTVLAHTWTTVRPRRAVVVLYDDAITERLILCIIGLVSEEVERFKELVNTVLPLVARRRPAAGQCPVFEFYAHIHRISWISSIDLWSVRKGEKNMRYCHCGCCKHNILYWLHVNSSSNNYKQYKRQVLFPVGRMQENVVICKWIWS